MVRFSVALRQPTKHTPHIRRFTVPKMSDEEIKQFIERHYADVQYLRDNPDAMAEELEERIALGIAFPPGHKKPSIADEDKT